MIDDRVCMHILHIRHDDKVILAAAATLCVCVCFRGVHYLSALNICECSFPSTEHTTRSTFWIFYIHRKMEEEKIDIQLEYRAKTPSPSPSPPSAAGNTKSSYYYYYWGESMPPKRCATCSTEHGRAHIAFILVDLIQPHRYTSCIVPSLPLPTACTVYDTVVRHSSLLLYFRFSLLLPRCRGPARISSTWRPRWRWRRRRCRRHTGRIELRDWANCRANDRDKVKRFIFLALLRHASTDPCAVRANCQ